MTFSWAINFNHKKHPVPVFIQCHVSSSTPALSAATARLFFFSTDPRWHIKLLGSDTMSSMQTSSHALSPTPSKWIFWTCTSISGTLCSTAPVTASTGTPWPIAAWRHCCCCTLHKPGEWSCPTHWATGVKRKSIWSSFFFFFFFLTCGQVSESYEKNIYFNLAKWTRQLCIFPLVVNSTESLNSKEFTKDSPASKDLSFKENVPQPVRCKNGREKRPPLNPSRWNQRPPANRNARFQGSTVNLVTMLFNYSNKIVCWCNHLLFIIYCRFYLLARQLPSWQPRGSSSSRSSTTTSDEKPTQKNLLSTIFLSNRCVKCSKEHWFFFFLSKQSKNFYVFDINVSWRIFYNKTQTWFAFMLLDVWFFFFFDAVESKQLIWWELLLSVRTIRCFFWKLF